MEMPILETKRLLMRPFTLADAPRVQLLAGNIKVAETTGAVPHPYENGVAEAWISNHVEAWEGKRSLTLALETLIDKQLVGCISLVLHSTNNRAELGYWVGESYWNKGYCTETAYEIMFYAFKHLKLNKITARHISKNPASGRVMQKLGMVIEAEFKKHFLRLGEFQDVTAYGLLEADFNYSQ